MRATRASPFPPTSERVSAVLPPDLVSAADYLRRAESVLPPDVWAWLAGGAGDEVTRRANEAAWLRYALRQRVLCRRADGHTRVSLFGQTLRHPIVLAPVAQQRRCHPDGERAVAQAAAATDTVMVASTQSSVPMETIAAECPGRAWFQLYLQPRRSDTLALVRRAEAAGFGALVLTVDAPVQALPRAAQRCGFAPSPQGAVNLSQQAPVPPRELAADDSPIFQGAMADAADFDDVSWLRGQTRLPLIAKGVTDPDDADHLRAIGVDGLVVSNHGGRVLDGVPASLDALSAIRARVGADLPILIDGGIRSGQDVFKAMALGAHAVMIGRPYVAALSVAGALGVAHLIRLLRTELELTMALCARFTPAEIDASALLPAMDVPC